MIRDFGTRWHSRRHSIHRKPQKHDKESGLHGAHDGLTLEQDNRNPEIEMRS